MTEVAAIRLARRLTCWIPNKPLRRRLRNHLRYRFWCPPRSDEKAARAAFLKSVWFETETPRTVALPTSETPLVSIVVPVYNNYDLTMRCLAAIAAHTDGVPFEVILADDASTDETIRIRDFVTGLRVVRTAGNLRFLRNCNHAAEFARGKYILFLNNDTQVQDGWLPPLVAALEGDATIGFVGSMLLAPDLSVQECGMVMASDGVATAFGGRHPAPWRPAFRGLRDVDYVSGAAIMLPTSLWRELGGFDEIYAPAYYEDSDLAYRVRARGLRVVCEPASRVIHCCGASAGDGSAGQKAAFETNRQKFAKRWFGAECKNEEKDLTKGENA